MSENPPKKLEEIDHYDLKEDSTKLISNSTPNLGGKRSSKCLEELNRNRSQPEVKRRKIDQKHTSVSSVASCSKKHISKLNQTNSADLKQILLEELTCSVCSELFIEPVTLDCSHSFCSFCILKWMREQSTCPVCRKEINSRNPSLILDRFVGKMMELLPEETKNHRKNLIETRENQKESDDTLATDSTGSANDELFNDFLCWFRLTEFMEMFEVRNPDEDYNYNDNENCTIN